MTLLCQKNSYLREFNEAAIKSIVASKLAACSNGGTSTWIDGFDIVLEDTIFFPEGGGQPFDCGTLDDRSVINVRRNGDQAILFVPNSEQQQLPFEIGDRPMQKIDWRRRFDHMQQHTGQHLITAIAMNQFSLPTTSWSLGAETSFIEIDTKEISDDIVRQIEDEVNRKIRDRIPISVSYRDDSDDIADVRFHRDVPEDQRGSAIRIVSIDGIDRNTCCGTHVENLADLQAIKLLGTQKGKKGKTQLCFVAGGRVLSYLAAASKREQALTVALKCPAEELISMVEKQQKTVKRLQKNCLQTLRDLGRLEGERYVAMTEIERPRFFSLHRKEGDFDFILSFMNVVGDRLMIADRLVLLSVADDSLVNNSAGQILIAGNESMMKKASEIALERFAAKGSVQRGRFRGRIPDVSKLPKLEEQICAEVIV